MRTRLPCVKYRAGGRTHCLWLAPVATLTVDPSEPGLAHALATARAERGSDIRIEFYKPGVSGRPVLSVEVP
jgi:hypothetical protein